MNRIDQMFASLRRQQRSALIPFITCGDPAATDAAELMTACVAAGADVVELGMPFSDPMADGPVIQAASERALSAGMNLAGVLQTVTRFRETDQQTPVVLMGYLNPVVRFGQDNFCQAATAAGVDGVLLVDMPIEEEGGFRQQLAANGIHPIMLIAPTTGASRRRRVLAAAAGFVYYVRIKGITGAATGPEADIDQTLTRLAGETELPVAVGFGIKDGATAARMAKQAAAVVIGSALIERLAAASDPLAEAGRFLGSIRTALASSENH